MPKEKLSQVLSDLKAALQRIYGDRLAKLVLFGSQARGDAKPYPNSDIDVLVVLKGDLNGGEEIFRSGESVAGICLEHDVVISRVFVSEAEYTAGHGPLLRNVLREGIAL